MTSLEKLGQIIAKNNSLVCVGLDSDINKLPAQYKNDATPQFSFNKTIIDATHDLVCAYKPNTAFYEARGAQGIAELKMTCDYVIKNYPEIFIIIDAKRADIGNTNNGYVEFIYDYLNADAITLQPYPGGEALKPFLERKDKANIVWCKSSNPGALELQDLSVNGKKVWEIVAENIATKWNYNNNCMLVIGATYPDELADARAIAPGMFFLVPGIGAQGGDVEKTVKAGLNNNKTGMIINSSRGIIFASSNDDFAKRAREETEKLKNEINKFRL